MLSGSLLGQQIYLQMLSNGIGGEYSLSLARALGNGIVNSILINTYGGISTGVGPGVGASTGSLNGPIVMGAALTNLIYTGFLSNSIMGSSNFNLSKSIGDAVAQHMTFGVISATSIGVAVGTGSGTVIGPNGISMSLSIQSQLASEGLLGQFSPNLALSIGNAISAALSSSFVTTIVVGAPLYPSFATNGVETGNLT